MGAVVSGLVAVAAAIPSLIRLFSRPPAPDPTHTEIVKTDKLVKETEEREESAGIAKQEADRLAKEADMNTQRAQEAQVALDAARAEAERFRREAGDERIAAERAAEVAKEEAKRREAEIREEARKAAEAVEREVLRREQLAEEENRRAEEARRLAEEAARVAMEEAQVALEAKADLERQLREGIQPIVMPTAAELEDAKRRIGYQEGLYHFAVAGVAGSGKSSLINALRGMRNGQAGAAATGITETTLTVARLPDPDPKHPFVWYDIPGAGTLKVEDWLYFHKQGLYVFDALVVLVDNRFTKTDIAILRNARLFKIPCYIVRSKADVHIRNIMRERGYESDDEEYDVEDREKLEEQARDFFVKETRHNVQQNLRDAVLPQQRVYVVSNSKMLSAIKGNAPLANSKKAKKFVDEYDFLLDVLRDADRRRGSGAAANQSSK
ncbi:p-loop containing nucleoside triphosphate hydrolase protein [Favolaschia claudopus]|uniref:P-loop containing nucleoside triphosphate hydrolase protein n=1 Tax=Favolaschia claudopus TaxID=2862362 RepID=A0AAW0EDX5_9AGAR